ncbi:MAG: hypothetical protein J0I45_16550 [Bosea sp.]|nr:hypothetical protein [Bosea sp. (in: a-proteobacteria)]
MTTATREELLRLADSCRLQAKGARQAASDAIDPELRSTWMKKSDECATISHALRRLAEAEGQEAMRERAREMPPEPEFEWVLPDDIREAQLAVSAAVDAMSDALLRHAYRGSTSPPPAPGYAEGRRDGLEEAAKEAWLQSKQGATHGQIAAAIRAMKEGK